MVDFEDTETWGVRAKRKAKSWFWDWVMPKLVTYGLLGLLVTLIIWLWGLMYK